MWLIDNMTLRLVDNVDPAPNYAILSHTWGKEEVSFQDFSEEPHTETLRRKAGYSKIRTFCQIAYSMYGWRYGWVDTCCIDKKSSAELSEAINSMYTLYQSSQVCIVYLADVDLDQKESRQSERRIAEFRASRWFTRGFTLQELLAPTSVEFYGSDWTVIGNAREKDITKAIIKATNIKSLYLTDPKHASVATKMSWAAHRKTTRTEDIAYCLMGLFDVSMPLLYGEGMKAFRRLQEEIIKSSNDESIFAWATRRERFDNSLAYDGILAPSPAAFAFSGDIVPCFPPREDPRPYMITNYGLQIDLTFQRDYHPADDGVFLPHQEEPDWTHWIVPFACRKEDGSSGYFKVRLGMPSAQILAGDLQKVMFFRRNPHSIEFFKREEINNQRLPSDRFYIQLSR